MSLHGQAEEQTRTKKDVQIARKKLKQFILAQKQLMQVHNRRNHTELDPCI